MGNIDLHIHTKASDGTFSPRKLIDYAISKKIKVIAITDHNSVSGISQAIEYSKGKDIQIIPGVEIDCYEPSLNVIIHVIGLFIDPENKILVDSLNMQKRKVLNYAKRAIKAFLRKTIFYSFLRKLKNKLIKNKPVAAPALSLEKAVKIINHSGGIAILAHPGIIDKEKLIPLIKLFKRYGGKGIEVYYSYDRNEHFTKEESEETIINMKKLARKENLLISGGSDFHGYGRNSDLGETGLSLKDFEKLKQELNLRR